MKNKENLGIIVMENCQELGLKVNKEIKKIRNSNDNYIIPIDVTRFNDGEGKATILNTIRGKDVYIISDTHNYSLTYNMYGFTHNMSPDEHFQDIKRVISAIMGHAKSIRVVTPFLYASRQHKRKARESLDCALALQELKNLGISGIITFDAHDPSVQNAIPTLPFDNFYPTNDMLKEFLKKEEFNTDNTLVVSPDTGAMDRARFFADTLHVDVGLFYKRRDISKVVNGHNPIVAHEYLGKDVKGQNIIIVDDMIASGTSVLDVAKELKKRGAKKIFFFTTFALFTTGPSLFDNAYKERIFDAIYTTNLTYIPEEILKKPWMQVVDCSEYLAKIIDNLNKQNSISGLIKDTSAVNMIKKL